MWSDTFLAKFLSWNLPNTTTIPIAEFCNLLEQNIGYEWPLSRYKHLYWWFEFDYRNLLKELDIGTKDKVCRYLLLDLSSNKKRPRYDF